MSNTDKSFLIGLNIHHKDGTAGEIIQFIQNKPGYFMVRFKDGVTVAQSGNKLFYNSISVNELEKNDLVILESSLNQNISEENSSFRQFEHEILKTLTLDVPITMILGEAGTGKSTLISSLRDKLKGNVPVIAFTGVAALHVSGETIHSFFGFPITILTENTLGDPRHKEKIKSLNYLIIDEISMVRADILDAIFNTLTKYGPNPNKIFGGIRVILVGDILQLDPVLDSDDDARRYFYNKYQSSFFFESRGFLENNVSIHVLKHKFRQENDSVFGDILSRMRIGKSTSEDLKILNRFVNKSSDENIKNATWLTNTNERVEAINQSRLNQLPGNSVTYKARISGDFPSQNFPTTLELNLKLNAKIMFIKNDSDKSRRWVNGSIATITGLSENIIDVKILHSGLNVALQRTSWDSYKYFYDKDKDELESLITGSFEQFPITLAWATTIHKSQGKTLDDIYLDLPTDFRVMPTQLYVALSRTKKLENITLSRELNLQDTQVNKRAAQVWQIAFENNGKYGKFNLPNTDKNSTDKILESSDNNSNIDFVELIDSAINDSERIYMDYISKTGRKWRVVHPEEWLQFGVMFEAYCEDNEENRSFRIDRIHDARKI